MHLKEDILPLEIWAVTQNCSHFSHILENLLLPNVLWHIAAPYTSVVVLQPNKFLSDSVHLPLDGGIVKAQLCCWNKFQRFF